MSGTAEELRVSQPAVSRLIPELETRLGLRLFTRHGGRINATAEAHELWTEVERNLIGMKQIERAAGNFDDRGGLGLCPTGSFARQTIL